MKRFKQLLSVLMLTAALVGLNAMSSTCRAWNNCGLYCIVTGPVTYCAGGQNAICMVYDENGQILQHYFIPCGGGGPTLP